MSNIYEKLQNSRVKLQNSNLKKSGKNAYAGFEYFELSDIMPRLNEILQEEKLTFVIDFSELHASITLINSENPEESLCSITPYAEANLKGCQPIQNLGGQQTYLRRYLIVNMFNVTEPDLLDGTVGKDKSSKPQTKKADKKEEPKEPTKTYKCSTCQAITPENVAKFSYSKFKKVLCMNCQKEVK